MKLKKVNYPDTSDITQPRIMKKTKIPPAVPVEYIDSGSIGYFAFIPTFILVCGSIYFLILYLCN